VTSVTRQVIGARYNMPYWRREEYLQWYQLRCDFNKVYIQSMFKLQLTMVHVF